MTTNKQHSILMRRHIRQSGYRMQHIHTRRMQQNPYRWMCVEARRKRATLLSWARAERTAYAACLEARNRLPSNDDTPRAAVYWHMANVYARVGLGEALSLVLREEEAALLARIRSYNEGQERTWTHTWHGAGGYYGEDEAKTKMLHARRRTESAGVYL